MIRRSLFINSGVNSKIVKRVKGDDATRKGVAGGVLG